MKLRLCGLCCALNAFLGLMGPAIVRGDDAQPKQQEQAKQEKDKTDQEKKKTDQEKERTDPGIIQPTKIRFDHAGENDHRSYIRSVAPGEVISVTIVNTCAEKFAYDLRRIPKERAKPRVTAEIDPCPTKEKTLDIIHEEQYGGYIVSIRRTSKEPVQILLDKQPRTLNDVDLVISVPPRKWDYELAGAFTTSWLTDPAFAVEMRVPEGSADGTEKPFVVRDRRAEDDFRLGVAAFVNVFHTQLPDLALTFGMGINEENQTTYFTGLSWRLGDAAALTLGRAWGSVKRLPPGTQSDRPVDPGILGNLGSRTDSDWFFALSYKFLKPSAGLQKPFDKVQDQNAGNGGSPDSTNAKDSQDARKAGTDLEETSELDPPSDLKLEAVCEVKKSKVKLSWKGVKLAKEYAVFRSTKKECESEERLELKLDASAEMAVITEDTDVLPNTHYWYRVRALKDEVKSSKPTECKEVAVESCDGPG